MGRSRALLGDDEQSSSSNPLEVECGADGDSLEAQVAALPHGDALFGIIHEVEELVLFGVEMELIGTRKFAPL